MRIQSAKDLVVYQKSYCLAMEIFHLTKRFPPEERFALVSQIRRSSRSVSLNLREAWAKRRYEAHFMSKLTDCDGESNETDTALDFAKDCGFIPPAEHQRLVGLCDEVRRMLGAMLNNPLPFLTQENLSLSSVLCPLSSVLCSLFSVLLRRASCGSQAS